MDVPTACCRVGCSRMLHVQSLAEGDCRTGGHGSPSKRLVRRWAKTPLRGVGGSAPPTRPPTGRIRLQLHSGSMVIRKNERTLSSGSPNHFRYRSSKSFEANSPLKLLSKVKRKSSSLRASAKTSGSDVKSRSSTTSSPAEGLRLAASSRIA
jgi:hypothetical protein